MMEELQAIPIQTAGILHSTLRSLISPFTGLDSLAEEQKKDYDQRVDLLLAKHGKIIPGLAELRARWWQEALEEGRQMVLRMMLTTMSAVTLEVARCNAVLEAYQKRSVEGIAATIRPAGEAGDTRHT